MRTGHILPTSRLVGYTGIAAAVLARAGLDYVNRSKGAEKMAGKLGFGSLEKELQHFWQSDYGRELRRLLGVPRLGLEDAINAGKYQKAPKTP